MNEEFKGGPKNKWSRIYRKKWFFPAVYLTIAALLLGGVVWYQNSTSQPDATDTQDQTAENYNPVPNDEAAEPVLDQQELIQMPVQEQDQAEIVTKFFDYNAEQEDRENALVLYNNRFYQSTGVDIAAANAETFDVVAALSGTVEEVKEDPLLGNVVVLSHGDDVKTYYASLGEVSVTAGSEIGQGEKVGTAGKNLFGKDSGTHVHFEIRKDGKEVNPESYFNQPVSSLQEASEDTEGNEAVNEETNATDESEEVSDTEENTEEVPEQSPEEGADETDGQTPEAGSDGTDEESPEAGSDGIDEPSPEEGTEDSTENEDA